MYHLRVVAPEETAHRALELLCTSPSVTNVVHLSGAAKRPAGDLILADVAPEDTSLILSDLRELGLHKNGSIALEAIDTSISEGAERALEAAEGAPGDAVVWEQVEERTSENASLTWSFLAFMVLAALLASVGIMLNSAVLIVGAMVVGPEFGPIAGFCVAAVNRRPRIAAKSFTALAVGLPVAIVVAYATTVALKGLGLTPEGFSFDRRGVAAGIAHPDFFAFFVAFCAGVAGMLSLTTAKSGALLGVLISVTTIPAAAAVSVAAAHQDWEAGGGAALQLAINVTAILASGSMTLLLQRRLYARRRARHLRDRERAAAGLPTGSPATTTRPPSS